jgi:hypothetical protein
VSGFHFAAPALLRDGQIEILQLLFLQLTECCLPIVCINGAPVPTARTIPSPFLWTIARRNHWFLDCIVIRLLLSSAPANGQAQPLKVKNNVV